MSPFKDLYGYEAPTYVDQIFGEIIEPKAKEQIQEIQDILEALKNNLETAQNQQKMYAHRNRTERHFQENDLVYLRFQPYRQSNLKGKGDEKLKNKFYGPYRIVRKVD